MWLTIEGMLFSSPALTAALRQKSPLVLAFLFVLATLVIFREAVTTMVNAWQQEEYSHGYLVPLVALVMLFNKMNDAKIRPVNSWVGFVLVVVCVLAQFLFLAASVKGLQPQIFMLAIIGLYLLFYGLRSGRAVVGPLLFLMFAAPLPKFFYYTMSFNMQMLSTSLGTALLGFLGISVFQEGNIIDLGSYQLQVVEACNGLRYLFPLMALGFLLAIMYKASMIKRAILFASTIPITIVMNSLRIALIGVTVNQWGPEMAEGWLHDIEGWMVFAGCAVLLILEIQIMQRIGRKGALDFECIRLPKLKTIPLPSLGRPSWAMALFLGLALVVSVITPRLLPNTMQPVPLIKPLTTFPMQLGDWVGHMGKLDEKELEVLGTKDYLIADYTNTKTNEQPVNLYVLYYPQQDSTSNQAIHSPSVCIPAGGWMIESQAIKTILFDNDQQLSVNRMMISKDMAKQIVYYWFVQDGFPTPDANISKLHLLQNALIKGRTNGAMIRLSTLINGNETEQEAERRLVKYIGNTLTPLNAHLFKTTGVSE